MKPDKPFKTYDEQIEILEKERNLNIENREICFELLKTISYYDLVNGYKDIFMKNEKFKYGTTESEIFNFIIFDKNFQNILFKYSVYAENSFKTKLAYSIGKNLGILESEYLDFRNYRIFINDSVKEMRKKKKLKNIIKISNDCKDAPTSYYIKNHNHIPPWILFKNITFNHSIELYDFLKSAEKEEIVNSFSYLNFLELEEKKELLKTGITIIRHFRNKIAHNYKIINYVVDDFKLPHQHLLKIFPESIFNQKDSKNNIGENDLFSMILSLCLFLDNKILTILFLNEVIVLTSTFDDTSDLYIKSFKLPFDFKERLKQLVVFFETYIP